MKYVFRTIAAILFLVFFGFALKNTQEAALSFFWGYEMRGPLVLLLLGFFVGGAVLGILAMLPTVFRYRRELAHHKRQLSTLEHLHAQREVTSPSPDGMAAR
jgi:lipopolysaccharide assembly protein A